MMKTNIIVQQARTYLKETIISNLICRYRYLEKPTPNFKENEKYVLKFSDFENNVVGFEVELTDEDDFATRVLLTDVFSTADSNLFFKDKKGKEHNYEELTLDDLVKISKFLEPPF